MIDYFDANVAEDDGYLIYEDNYQIEICFRYYFPELKKYDWDSVAEIKGNIWYLEVSGYENERFKAQSYGYDAESKGDFSAPPL